MQEALGRRERAENGYQARKGGGRTADHQAIAAFGAPDTTTRADVDVLDASGAQLARTADVVLEIRVATVNDRVAPIEPPPIAGGFFVANVALRMAAEPLFSEGYGRPVQCAAKHPLPHACLQNYYDANDALKRQNK